MILVMLSENKLMEAINLAFQVTDEAVAVMRDLAKKISNTIDGLHRASCEVTNCYEQVKDTVGPHTRQIEAIVKDLERLLKKNAEDINAVSRGLIQLSNRCQLILDKKNFKDDLKVDFTPTVSFSDNYSLPEAPAIGQRIRQKGNQTEYEH